MHIPDPVAQEPCRMQITIDRLEKRLKELEKEKLDKIEIEEK